MFGKNQSNAAISDTIGTIIMVAVVFIAAGSVASFVLSHYGSVEEDVYAGVQFVTEGDGAVEVVWTERGTADYLRVSNGTHSRAITDLGESVSMWFGPQQSDISVIAVGSDSEETFITKFESPNFNSSVYARSQSCDSTCGASLVLNSTGSTIPTGPGLNILVFDENGYFEQHAYYDVTSSGQYRPVTYSLDGSGRPDVNSLTSCSDCSGNAVGFFDGIGAGKYILVVGGGDYENIPDDLQTVFNSFGAQYNNDNELERYDSWIVATQKTCDSACPEDEYSLIFEEHAPYQSGEFSVEGYFYAPQDE